MLTSEDTLIDCRERAPARYFWSASETPRSRPPVAGSARVLFAHSENVIDLRVAPVSLITCVTGTSAAHGKIRMKTKIRIPLRTTIPTVAVDWYLPRLGRWHEFLRRQKPVDAIPSAASFCTCSVKQCCRACDDPSRFVGGGEGF